MKVSELETKDGYECVSELSLAFIKSSCHFFSWTKDMEARHRIYSRIDHVLENALCMSKFSDDASMYLNTNISDHTPILVKHNEEGDGHPFNFLNYVVEHSSH